ncbi:Transmembrane protein 71, partial [Galemys pyrenaicus]
LATWGRCVLWCGGGGDSVEEEAKVLRWRVRDSMMAAKTKRLLEPDLTYNGIITCSKYLYSLIKEKTVEHFRATPSPPQASSDRAVCAGRSKEQRLFQSRILKAPCRREAAATVISHSFEPLVTATGVDSDCELSCLFVSCKDFTAKRVTMWLTLTSVMDVPGERRRGNSRKHKGLLERELRKCLLQRRVPENLWNLNQQPSQDAPTISSDVNSSSNFTCEYLDSDSSFECFYISPLTGSYLTCRRSPRLLSNGYYIWTENSFLCDKDGNITLSPSQTSVLYKENLVRIFRKKKRIRRSFSSLFALSASESWLHDSIYSDADSSLSEDIWLEGVGKLDTHHCNENIAIHSLAKAFCRSPNPDIVAIRDAFPEPMNDRQSEKPGAEFLKASSPSHIRSAAPKAKSHKSSLHSQPMASEHFQRNLWDHSKTSLLRKIPFQISLLVACLIISACARCCQIIVSQPGQLFQRHLLCSQCAAWIVEWTNRV